MDQEGNEKKVLVLLLFLSSWLVGLVTGHTECRTKCGDLDIRYPFGIDPGCGDPLHQLACSSSKVPYIPNVLQVTVTAIDYREKTITLNTTLFMKAFFENSNLPPPPTCELPLTLSDPNRGDSKPYDKFNDTVILCQPPNLKFEDTYLVPNCVFIKGSEVGGPRGLSCYGYQKEAPPSASGGGPYGGEPPSTDANLTTITNWTWISYARVPWNIVGDSELEEDCNTCNSTAGGTCGYSIFGSHEFLCLCEDANITLASMPQITCPGTLSANAPSPDDGSVQDVVRSRKKNTAVLAGGVGGGAAVAALILVVAGFCIHKKRTQTKQLVVGQGSSNTKFLSGQTSNNSDYSYSNFSGSSTRFTLEELEVATNGFSDADRLGDGGFGTVYKGQLKDGRIVAVKKLNPWNAQGKTQFDNEVTILSQVKHPHLVQLYGCCLEGRELLLVYEFVSNGTLSDHLHGGGAVDSSIVAINCSFLDWETRLNIATQTAGALSFLHTDVSPPIYHRDVKSTNILVDEHCNAKVGDFGLSRLVPSLELTHVTTAPQGTPGYLDPDYHQSYQLTDKSDVYSLGVVLMEIVSAKRAVDMSRGRKEINLAAMAVSRIQENKTEEIIDSRLGCDKNPQLRSLVKRVAELGFRCLAAEKDDRPCMREVHKQLQEILEETKKMQSSRSHSMARGVNILSTSPTTVQVKWSSHSSSPNDSSASM